MDAEIVRALVAGCTGALAVVGGQFGVQKWTRRNGSEPQSKAVCDAVHKGLDKQLDSIDKRLASIAEKLDRRLDE